MSDEGKKETRGPQVYIFTVAGLVVCTCVILKNKRFCGLFQKLRMSDVRVTNLLVGPIDSESDDDRVSKKRVHYLPK